ncbi:hypothetical protein LCGC14_2973670 [marine sediment metagenome]|uniref:Uncharacterized protein n=1 Tax=marine sediment metagenome TaxID=412755 RepID=A0A0F8XW55_9ZZZZ
MKIIKSVDSFGGMFFYIAYREDEKLAKIYYNEFWKEYALIYEHIDLTDDEEKEILEFRDKLNEELNQGD